MREVKRKHIKDTAVDQHVLAVITDKIVGGAGNNDSGSQKAEFQPAQVLCAPAVGKYDQGGHPHASFGCRLERGLHVSAIKSEDGNLNGLLRALDGGEYLRP